MNPLRLVHFLILLFGSILHVCATDKWTTYLSYHDNQSNVPAGSDIYSLCAGNVFVYDTKTTEVRLLSKLEGMNGKTVQFMGYSDTQHTMIFVYSDGNIDILYPNGTFINIPHLKQANSGDLEITNLSMCSDYAVISTNNGIVLVDMKKEEIKGVYNLGERVYAATIFDGNVCIAKETSVALCPIKSNLSDISLWTEWITASVRQLQPFAAHLYLLLPTDAGGMEKGLWVAAPANESGQRAITRIDSNDYTSFYADANAAVFSTNTRTILFHPQTPQAIAAIYTQNNTWSHLTRTSDGRFWASEGMAGLQAYTANDTSLVPNGLPVGNYGPVRDLFYYMRYTGDRLLVAGGRLDPYDLLHYPGTLMGYTDGGEWIAFQENNISPTTGVPYRDMTCIIQDPNDASHIFATSNTGLYEFRDYQFVNYYSNENSPLSSATKNTAVSKYFIRLDGLNYDPKGNLWMVNNGVDTVLRALKPDGSWTSIYVPELHKAPTLEKTLIDRDGRLWVGSRRTVNNHTSGLYCLDYNLTIDHLGDDISMYRTSCLNEDGTEVTLGSVYALAEDIDGRIWVGTGYGLYVVDNPDHWFDDDFTITQIKVPRNDGTNLADYLLEGVSVSAIALDGASRKWIGTNGSGLYLVSSDGTEIIHHFMTENSPLLSNNIYSLAVNQTTGEVMIGTDVGLCSYQSDTSKPADKLQKSAVRVYPNPVRPEYAGSVTITGLTHGADVIITTVGGQAVAGGTSTGGTYTWDVRDQHGRRVSSGVYYIMISSSKASQGVVAKVVVI